MTHLEFHSNSADNTREIGSLFASSLKTGLVVGMRGPLGAGKTEFVRGVAVGLGICEQVVSPTFVLESEYEIPPQEESFLHSLHHWDLYRLGENTSAESELFDYQRDSSKLVIIEWPERVPWALDLLSLKIDIGFAGFAQDEQVDSCKRKLVFSEQQNTRHNDKGLNILPSLSECAKQFSQM